MFKIAWKKNKIIAICVTAVIVLGSGGASYWIYQKHQETQQEEQDIQGRIAVAKVKMSKVPALEKEVIKLRENLKEYVKILPDTREVNEFVKKLTDFARQSGVEVINLKDANTRSVKGKKQKEVFDRESFKIDLTADISQFMKFISLIENYERFISISEITVKAGEFAEKTLRSEVKHDISMLVETFVYNGNEGAAGETNIQNYDKKKEMLIDEIRSARNEIQVEQYEYVYDPTIRDPFIDPRAWAGAEEAPEGLPLEEQERFIAGMVDRVYEIRGLYELVKNKTGVPLIRRLEIQKEVADGVVDLNAQLKNAVDQRWITDPACRKKLNETILPEMELINLESKDFSHGTSLVSTKELTFIRDELQRLLEKQDYEGCLWRYGVIQSQLGELLTAEAALDQSKGPICDEIEEIYIKAKVAKEFQGIPIKITGIVSQPERSVLIVNGQVLSEGQQLGEELLVERIEEKSAYFRFKGQLFKVTP